MKLSVVALDFDGTIARDDVLDPEVRVAITQLRAKDIVVVLVTGRILDDLKRVTGDLHFVDAVVAENGGVLEFPATGSSVALAAPPPDRLVEAVRADGIVPELGQVIVGTQAAHAPRLLEHIRRFELPLSLAFNRGRVMVLPQAVSKATGLRQALTILRLSPRNAVAIGDAENDHELLRVCEVGVAVSWGSAALQAAADYVIEGAGPSAVAGYLRALGSSGRIPAPLKARRSLLLGHADDGTPLSLAVRGRNVLVAGDPKSGKSWVTGLLCEQLILHGYCLCVVDPEGDYVSLEALPGVSVFGGADPLPRPRDLLRALRHPDASVVIDLSHAAHQHKLEYVHTVLPALALLQRHTGLPHRIVLDEAHHFLTAPDVTELVDSGWNGYTFVTYRASKLPRAVLQTSQAVIVTRESDPGEVCALHALGGADRYTRCSPEDLARMFGGLVVGEAILLPITDEAGGSVRRIRLTPRLTPHARHLSKYLDVPVSEGRAFVFWQNGVPSGRRARTLREFVHTLEGTPTPSLTGHLERHDFSRWIEDVFGDFPLSRSVRALEHTFRTHGTPETVSRLAETVRTRYEFVDPVPTTTPDGVLPASRSGEPGAIY